MPAVELGKPEVEAFRRVDDAQRQACRSLVVPGGCETGDRDRGVVGPDRAAVVAERVVTRPSARTSCAARSRSPCPAQPAGRHQRALGRRRAAGAEQVADVGGHRVDRRPVAVERDRRVARRPRPRSRTPRGTACRKRGRPSPATRRRPPGRTRRAGRRPHRRLVRVAPAPRTARSAPRRARPSRHCTESPESFQPWLARPRPVASTYSRKPSPSASPSRASSPAPPRRFGSSARDLGGGQAPAPGVVQQADPQRGRVDRAEVQRRAGRAARRARRRRARTSCRILPGSSSAARRRAGALAAGERAQRAGGELGAERQQHRAAQIESRPKRVRYHGAPAAEEVVVGRRGSASKQPVQVGEAAARPARRAGGRRASTASGATAPGRAARAHRTAAACDCGDLERRPARSRQAAHLQRPRTQDAARGGATPSAGGGSRLALTASRRPPVQAPSPSPPVRRAACPGVRP